MTQTLPSAALSCAMRCIGAGVDEERAGGVGLLAVSHNDDEFDDAGGVTGW